MVSKGVFAADSAVNPAMNKALMGLPTVEPEVGPKSH